MVFQDSIIVNPHGRVQPVYTGAERGDSPAAWDANEASKRGPLITDPLLVGAGGFEPPTP